LIYASQRISCGEKIRENGIIDIINDVAYIKQDELGMKYMPIAIRE
jgi:hypothetical protein